MAEAKRRWAERLTPEAIGGGFVFAVVFGVGFAPLFGAPGYEQALLTGLVAPSTAAVAAARALSLERRAPVAQLLRGASLGARYAAIAFASSLLHGVRVGFCSLGGAALYFALTAGVGTVLGGLWGGFVAEGARRARRPRLHAALFGIALPLGAALVSVGRFVRSPMVFAYDPFVGYFAGTLYDTVIDAGTPLLTYRLGSLASAVAAFALASLFVRRDDGGLVLDRSRPHFRAGLTLAAIAAGASFGISVSGPALGHWHTPESIARALGGRDSGPRCDVIHPDDMPRDVAALLVRDCEEQLALVEEALGARGPERITAYFFRDAGEKKALMGAGDTYIAKPWRREVYLQVAAYPHPVLAHELAHVVAGSFGVGPFRVAGRYGGLLPDPGMIEGVAVAAAPEHDVLSELEWSRAMLELGILPKLSSVFSLGFLGEASSKSYTVAGAVVQYLMDTAGKDKVRAIYKGTPPEIAVGQSWDAIDAAFRAHLRTLPFSPDTLAYAKARFDRPAVFGRRCPHEIDALVHEAAGCRDALKIDKALFLYDAALAKNPREMPALLGRATTHLRAGDLDAARGELRSLLADEHAPRTLRDRAEEALADADFRSGRFVDAAERYRALAGRVLDEDFGRTLEVKALLTLDPLGRGPLEALLVGLPGRGPDMTVALARVEAWRSETHDPLADYLLGRNLVAKSLPDASAALKRAVTGPLPTARVRREAARQLVIAACMAQDRPLLETARGAVTREVVAGAPGGWREDVERQIRACAR